MGKSRNRGTSPIVVGLLFIVLIVAGSILVYVFLVGAQQGFNTNSTGINAVISPALYSSNAKVGVYGGLSNFTISLSNSLTTTQAISVNITSNGHLWQSNSLLLLPSQTTTITLAQRLNATGVWAVKVAAHGVPVTSYYFQVFGSRDEADFAVAQWRDQDFYGNVIRLSLVISFISLVVSAASIARRPKTIIQAGK